jgi:rod shape-determining protein MreD
MMLRHMATACLIYLTLLLQTGIAVDLTMHHDCKPWFPGIALIICVLLHEGPASLVWSATLGLATDGLSGERLGFHTVIVTIVAMGLLAAKQDIRSFGTLPIIVFIFVGTFAWRTFSVTAFYLLARQSQNFLQLMQYELVGALYTALMTAVLLLFVDLVNVRKRAGSHPPILTNRWSMLTR